MPGDRDREMAREVVLQIEDAVMRAKKFGSSGEWSPVAIVAEALSAARAERMEEAVTSIRELLEICRQWEPDYSSGEDRHKLWKAHELLKALSHPSTEDRK